MMKTNFKTMSFSWINLAAFFLIALVNSQIRADYAPYPEPGPGYVTDNANILSDDEEERIETWLWQLESSTGIEIAVVTINRMGDYATGTQSIEEFAKGLFDKYKIGNMPKNNGILFLVSIQDRKARIELGAGFVPEVNSDAQRIMNNVIVPYFRGGDYAGGITEGVRELAREYGNVTFGFPWHIVVLLAAIGILIVVAFSLFRSGKRGWGWVVVGLIVVLILLLIYLSAKILRHLPDSGGAGSAGGFGGGFGGGFSGGGGATGSW